MMLPVAVSSTVVGLVKTLVSKGVVGSVSDALEQRRARKVERAFELLVQSLVDLEGLPAAEQEARVEALLLQGEPGTGDAHEALYEMFRTFAFTRTEAAWPYIARMTAGYLARGQGVDDFFRRVAWLLERCGNGDVSVLVQLVTDCRPQLDKTTEGFHLLAVGTGIKVEGSRKTVTFADGGMFLESHHHREAVPTPGRDIIVLLRDSRLALPGRHQDSCFLPATVANRLCDVFVAGVPGGCMG